MRLPRLLAPRYIIRGILACVLVSTVVFIAVSFWPQKVAAVAPAEKAVVPRTAPEPKVIRKNVQAARGDTLSSLLLDAGVGPNDLSAITAALSKVYNPRSLKPGDDINLTLDSSAPSQLVSLQIPVSTDSYALVRRGDGMNYSAVIAAKEISAHESVKYVVISKALYADGLNAGIPGSVLMDLIDQYSYEIDFGQVVHSGDALAIMWRSYVDSRGNSVGSDELLMGRIYLDQKTYELYAFTGKNGITNYYDAQGQGVKRALLRAPVRGYWVSSPFGWRVSPFTGAPEFHEGIDYAVPFGTPIMAAGDGIVQSMSYDPVYGYHVVLKHMNGYTTLYAHMEAFARGLRVGAWVAQEQVIGYVGVSGESTGPHVHYEVRVWGRAINPATLNVPGQQLKGSELTAFLAQAKFYNEEFAELTRTNSLTP